MSKKIIKVKIDGYEDRNRMVNALARNGHKVWVEKKRNFPSDYDFFVCFERPQTGGENERA
ncbi:MAG: hypothetical protein JXA96_17155 [Sedimentisphaerales bacterium]|nr:hypothetical protein [Sedimentisphaerales bacterium]